jgi:hypothetical protein
MWKFLLTLALLPGIAVAAEQRNPKIKSERKPAPVAANPCVQYGDGFVLLPGTTTCVKASGSMRVEFGTGR